MSGMTDYAITMVSPSELGIVAKTERAKNRKYNGIKIGESLVFKRDEYGLRAFVEVAEMAGFSVEGKQLAFCHAD